MKELTLREIQEASLNVLVQFDRICRKIGVSYFLAYGTLIGAVRHNGIIPWDDDVDVWLMRKDFDKITSYLLEHEKEIFPFKLCNRKNTKNYKYYIPRFCDMKYKYVSDYDETNTGNMGIFIDLYPLDNYGNSEEFGRKLRKRINMINARYAIYVDKKSYTGGLVRSIMKKIVHYFLHLKYGTKYSQIVDKKIDMIIKRCTSEKDSLVGPITWEDRKSNISKKYFDGILMHDFENYMFPIPRDYDEILRSIYGDYMKLPPEEERVPHHFYKIYERDLPGMEP